MPRGFDLVCHEIHLELGSGDDVVRREHEFPAQSVVTRDHELGGVRGHDEWQYFLSIDTLGENRISRGPPGVQGGAG
jgi:hypothetical protein